MESSLDPEEPKHGNLRELENKELWPQLENCIALRSSQDQVLWRISGIFWAANAILLVALFPGGDLPKNPWVGVVLSSVGVGMSYVWHVLQQRALGHVKRHEENMRRIESKLGFDPKYAVSADVNQEDYARFLGKGLRARQVNPASSTVGECAWAASLVFFIYKVAETHLGKWGVRISNVMERQHIGLVLVSIGALLWAVYLYRRNRRESIAPTSNADPNEAHPSYPVTDRKWLLWSGLILIQAGTYLQW